MRRPSISLRCQLALLAISALAACFGSGAQLTEQQARTSLNVYADIIDPVYEVAMQACIDRQDQLAGDLTTRTLAELQAIEAKVAEVSARCHRVRDSFDLIRSLHARARASLEAGQVDEALHIVEEIRQAWRELRERTNP